ncbi:polyphosphate polymerase domain-containing protein [Tepidanaerobacter syntrophicus]|uniref:polyphosphate polymerase domain-containing protein n=1 Tax=Tepidanaerobacter syntrophicus TaxID=224999 RepID=UPI001BD57974|nr:polyphosphate polymerase domain-containing protein [Tepidanaerobacter syntrophicus]
MAIETFNRYERKFLIDKSTAKSIQDKLTNYMEPDEYNKNFEFYTIANLYLDTEDDYLIRRSLASPQYKEKLRIRAYGVPREDELVYLEIKKKVSGFVNKRRTALKLKEVYDFINTGIKPKYKEYMNSQVLDELAYAFKIYKGLKIKTYIAYDRKAFFCKEDKNLRITFDTNIRTRRYDLKLENGDYGEKLIDNNKVLMEIKTASAIPFWLSMLLSERKIYPTSFSKYGTEYIKTRLNSYETRKGESKTCSRQFLARQQLIPQYL